MDKNAKIVNFHCFWPTLPPENGPLMAIESQKMYKIPLRGFPEKLADTRDRETTDRETTETRLDLRVRFPRWGSDQKLWESDARFWRNNQKYVKIGHFWPKIGQNGQILSFPQKSKNVTFLHSQRLVFMQKIRKFWCADF